MSTDFINEEQSKSEVSNQLQENPKLMKYLETRNPTRRNKQYETAKFVADNLTCF